jgi:hypothetical protein
MPTPAPKATSHTKAWPYFVQYDFAIGGICNDGGSISSVFEGSSHAKGEDTSGERAFSGRNGRLVVESVADPAIAVLYKGCLVLVASRADTPPADPSVLVDRVRSASASTS